MFSLFNYGLGRILRVPHISFLFAFERTCAATVTPGADVVEFRFQPRNTGAAERGQELLVLRQRLAATVDMPGDDEGSTTAYAMPADCFVNGGRQLVDSAAI